MMGNHHDEEIMAADPTVKSTFDFSDGFLTTEVWRS